MNLHTEGVSKGIGLSTYILSYCAGIPPQEETGSKAARALRLRVFEKNFLAPQYDIIQKTGLP
jgi:hypothetical protein